MLSQEQLIDESEDIYEVERIVGERLGASDAPEYRVKWKGWADKYNTWEPWENLDGAEELLENFKRNSGANKKKPKKRKKADDD